MHPVSVSPVSDMLDLLRCPHSQQALELGDNVGVAQLNALIARKDIVSQNNTVVTTPVDGLLVTADGLRGYPIRNGIPVMLYAESISLESL